MKINPNPCRLGLVARLALAPMAAETGGAHDLKITVVLPNPSPEVWLGRRIGEGYMGRSLK